MSGEIVSLSNNNDTQVQHITYSQRISHQVTHSPLKSTHGSPHITMNRRNNLFSQK